MIQINNLKLLGYSLAHKEPYIEDCYIKKGGLLISEAPENPTPLMRANILLIKAISAYEFASKHKNEKMALEAIEEICECVKQENINYSEFVSFWPVVDISYSMYCNMDDGEKNAMVRRIADKYIKMRHGTYMNHGYSSTTLQVGKDAKAHKESGSPGLAKVSKILGDNGYKEASHESVDEFVSGNVKKYIEADKKGKRLFKQLLQHYGIRFNWSKNREGKMPDFLLRVDNNIVIIEHKHMKEGGGGQDKQINEIINFVGHSEDKPNIHYVAFLDGIYFNVLADNKSKNNKLHRQLEYIKSILRGNKNNFFVNTAGFAGLLNNLS